MSINLPHWFVEVVDLLGFMWPEIDEDQLAEAGRHLREYAEHSSRTTAAHGRQIADLGQQYDGQSYASLAEAWSNQSHANMESLIQGCRLMAGGMDLAADGVVAMKGKVLVQLGIAAAEVVAVQAAAVATVGAAEAAMPALIAAQNRILNGILHEFAAETDHSTGSRRHHRPCAHFGQGRALHGGRRAADRSLEQWLRRSNLRPGPRCRFAGFRRRRVPVVRASC